MKELVNIRDISQDIKHWSESEFREEVFKRVFYLLDTEERLDRKPLINVFLTGTLLNQLYMFYPEYRNDLSDKIERKNIRLKKEISYYHKIISHTTKLNHIDTIEKGLFYKRAYMYILLSLLSLLIMVDLWIIPLFFSIVFFFLYLYFKSEVETSFRYREKFLEIILCKLYQARMELYYLNKEE